MQRTTIIGSNNQTPGAATAPSTLLTDTTTTTGLTINQGSGSPSTQPYLEVVDGGNVLFRIDHSGNQCAINMRIGYSDGTVFSAIPTLNGQVNPPCIEFPDGSSRGQKVWSGTGAPGSGTVGTAAVGDWYLRRDTPSTANQRLYVCTVAGTPGTWSGIA